MMIYLNSKWREISTSDHGNDWYDNHERKSLYENMSTISLLDTDLRREIFVMAPTDVFFSGESDEKIMLYLAVERIYPHLSPTALIIRLDNEGRIEWITSDIEMLKELRKHGYIPVIVNIERPLLAHTCFSDWPTTHHSKLIERDRFTPSVDLVQLADNPELNWFSNPFLTNRRATIYGSR